MRTGMRKDLTAALKARDHTTIAALRAALAAIENAEAQPADHPVVVAAQDTHFAGSAATVGAADVERRELTDNELHAILAREIDERSTSASEYEQLGRDDYAQRLRAEADVLRGYLPADGS